MSEGSTVSSKALFIKHQRTFVEESTEMFLNTLATFLQDFKAVK